MKTCIKCGGAEFYKNGACKSCSKAYSIANKDRINAYAAVYRSNNSEKVKANVKAWRELNPGRVKELAIAWYAANRDEAKKATAARYAANPVAAKLYAEIYRGKNKSKKRIDTQNRRAKQRKDGCKLSLGLAKKLFTLKRGKCACCGEPLGEDYHLDHIMPIALGGANSDENIQLLRQNCNSSKRAKHPVDFMQSRGFLL
jgi:hypothetical protein